MGSVSQMASVSTLADGQLLGEVASSGSEECFQELVRRHGAMVFNVCNRLLGNLQDAEDAAQAVFLLLWKKATGLRKRETVAGWLHETARRICSNARKAQDARRKHEQATSELIERTRSGQGEWDDIKEILDEELDRLPGKYKLVVILFHLECRSLDEIGGLLDLKRATVGTRLSRGRELLRSRLIRRGVTLTIASLAASLSTSACVAAVPASFIATTTEAVMLFAAGKVVGGGVLTAKSSALAKGVSHALTMAKVKATAAAVFVASSIVAGGGMVAIATSDSGAVPSRLDEITEAYKRQYATLSSLRAEYERTASPLISMKAVFECNNLYELSEHHALAIMDREGRTYVSWTQNHHPLDAVHRWLQETKSRPDAEPHDWTFEEIRSALPHVPVEPDQQLSFFTGEKLIKAGGKLAPRGVVERSTFLVKDVSRLKSAHFSESPLYYSLMAFPCPQMPADEELRKKHRIPEMFELRTYAVNSRTEEVNGVECVVVESPANDTLWLAPKMNFAVVKRRMFFERALRLEIECGGFQKITSEVWLPRRMTVTEFAVEGFMPEEYAGRAIVKRDYRFTKLDANSSEHEEFFVFNPAPGSIIIDQTLGQRRTVRHVDGSSATPAVSYIAPADKEDMDAVIAQAVREQTARGWWPLGLWMAIVVTGAAIALVGYAVVRRRYFAR